MSNDAKGLAVTYAFQPQASLTGMTVVETGNRVYAKEHLQGYRTLA